MQYKVKVTMGGKTKSCSVERTAPFADVKAKLESKFGCSLSLSFKRPDGSTLSITGQEALEQALRDAAASGAKFLQLDCGGSSTQASRPSTTAAAAPQPQPSSRPAPQQPQQAPAPAPAPVAAASGGFMFCPSCGTKLPSGSRFCAGCGSPITAQAAPKPQQPQAPSAAPQPTNVCPGCGKAVSGSTVKALDKTWHEACFVCRKCKKAISGAFHAEDGFPVCKSCYEEGAERCAGCGKALTGSYVVCDDGKAFHSACFVCAICGTHIEGSYLLRSGKPVCDKCAH